MTRTEHLLFILAEECAEVAQRASKAARFGLTEKQPDHQLDNAERIALELDDLYAVVGMLRVDGSIRCDFAARNVRAKELKVEKYLEYARQLGTLTT